MNEDYGVITGDFEFETFKELMRGCYEQAMIQVAEQVAKSLVDEYLEKLMQAMRDVVRESEGWEGF